MIRNAIKRPQAQLHIRVVLCDSYSECVRVKCIKCACIMHDIKTLSVTMWPLFFPQVLNCAAIWVDKWTVVYDINFWIHVKSNLKFHMWPLYSRYIDGQDEFLSWITWSNKFAWKLIWVWWSSRGVRRLTIHETVCRLYCYSLPNYIESTSLKWRTRTWLLMSFS